MTARRNLVAALCVLQFVAVVQTLDITVAVYFLSLFVANAGLAWRSR